MRIIHTKADSIVRVYINNAPLETDVPAQIVNDRTLVPMRPIFEALHPAVDIVFNEEHQIITAVWAGGMLEMRIGRDFIHFNNERRYIPVPPYIINGRTMVPAGVVAEVFGAEVVWNDVTRSVHIYVDHDSLYGRTGTIDTVFDYRYASVQTLLALGYEAEQIMAVIGHYIFVVINELRASYGVNPVEWLGSLARASRGHSRDMAINNYFSHTSLTGLDARDRASVQGYTADVVEGIATFTSEDSPFTIVQRWYGTARQRDTMLQFMWLHYGVGVYFVFCDEGTVNQGYVVQLFGRGGLD
jgi:hypothetical protein